MKLRIYTASKLSLAPFWITLRADWPEFDFTAHWPNGIGVIPDTPQYAERFWPEDLRDVARSDVVLVYARPQDLLRGALVEVGFAFAHQKRVLTVGANESYGTWQFHPLCSHARDLDHARALLGEWSDEAKGAMK